MARGRTPGLMTLPMGQSSGLTKLEQMVEQHIAEDDLKTIVTTFVEKAKSGHEPSARFVIDYLLGGRKTPQSVTVNQFFGDGDQESHTLVGATAPEATALDQVSIYLSAAGRATPKLIAADTGLPESEVVSVLDNNPNRFHVNGKHYTLAK